MDKKTILITGGAGYVSSALVPYLLSKGYKVVVYDLYLYGDVFNGLNNPDLVEIKRDIRDKEKLVKAGEGVDQLIHLACISNDPSFELNPALGKSINYDAFFNVIETVKKNNIKRLIFASSASSYGVKDGDVTEETPQNPITDYALYKVECEKVLRNSDLNYVVVRPATVCGYAARLRLDLVVNTLTSHALINKKIKVIGGSLLRPNINIKDMVRIYGALIEAPDNLISSEVFNASYQNMAIKEIAQRVKKVLNGDIVLEEVPTNDIRSYQLNSEKIKRVLNFEFKYDIDDAIMSIKNAFDSGLIINGLNNPLYHNIKMMRQVNLK